MCLNTGDCTHVVILVRVTLFLINGQITHQYAETIKVFICDLIESTLPFMSYNPLCNFSFFKKDLITGNQNKQNSFQELYELPFLKFFSKICKLQVVNLPL